jgi:hypothetical protein
MLRFAVIAASVLLASCGSSFQGGEASGGSGGESGGTTTSSTTSTSSGTTSDHGTGQGPCAGVANGVEHGGHCYAVVQGAHGLAFDAAEQACGAIASGHRGHLVHIDSGAEQAFVESALLYGEEVRWNDAWIGLRCGADPATGCYAATSDAAVAARAAWRWVDDQSACCGPYDGWATGALLLRPDGLTPGCATLRAVASSDSTRPWWPRACDATLVRHGISHRFLVAVCEVE